MQKHSGQLGVHEKRCMSVVEVGAVRHSQLKKHFEKQSQ
jgi:hypothetical protein